ncbi:MAG: protein TolR [Pseudomonadota bacterium]
MGASVRSAARSGGRRGRTRPLSEINVTPFVDVMLVLLIIFMVAAPLLTVGVPLDLPETDAQALPQPDQEPLTVNIDGQGQIFIQDQPVAMDALLARMSAIQAAREDDQIYLRADRTLDYGRFMQVMGALNAAGFGNIALVADQREPGG